MVYTDEFAKQRFDENQMWIKDNLLYEIIMGSNAYGTNTPESDIDVVGIVMNKHEHLYPQNYGFIIGFDTIPNFKNCEYKGKNKRIVLDTGKDCEAEWHSLTDFFYLSSSKGSPNLVEILFCRKNLITFADKIAYMLRDNRRLFLSMRTFHAFKGYCFGQISRIKRGVVRWENEHECDNKNRKCYFEKHGYDIKMANNSLRLISNIEQIITENDIDLMRNKDECIAMRKGEWGTFEELEKYVLQRLKDLETLALTSSLSPVPHKDELHTLLASIIEEYYGSDSEAKKTGTDYVSAKMVLDRMEKFEKLLKGE